MLVLRNYVAGDSILLELEVKDMRLLPPQLYDPNGSGVALNAVRVILYKPDHTIAVDAPATKIRTGVYQLQYQSSSLGPYGIWGASITTSHEGFVGVKPRLDVFTLLEP